MLTDEDFDYKKTHSEFNVSIHNFLGQKNIIFKELPEVLLQLTEMENDGLLVIQNNAITVTEKGKPFVRNICMAFDLLLKRKAPQTQLFSMTV